MVKLTKEEQNKIILYFREVLDISGWQATDDEILDAVKGTLTFQSILFDIRLKALVKEIDESLRNLLKRKNEI